MGEAENRTDPNGKGFFIIRNGQKIAKYEAGKWMPLLPGVVVRITPDGLKIEMPHEAMSLYPPKADMCGAARDVCFGPIADIHSLVTTNHSLTNIRAIVARANA